MSRLIDADAFKEYICNAYEQVKHMYPDGGKLAKEITEAFCKDIDEQPTIDQQKWIPFHKRELTEEEQEMYPEWSYYLDCELPEDGEEILISSPTWGVYKDTFNNEGSDGCYLEGDEEIDDGMAWMPLPKPYKENKE